MGSVDDSYVLDSRDSAASYKQILHIQVPALQSGHSVEWELTTEDRAAAEEFAFERRLFARGLPVVAEAVYVVGDVSKVCAQSAQSDDWKTIASERLRAWIIPSRVAAVSELVAPRRELFHPELWLGGVDVTWEAIAKQYLAEIDDRLQPDQGARSLVLGTTGGMDDPLAKLALLARLVQRDTAYKAIEFGVRARRPNTPTQTMQLRYGDCKDHALLLHQLLREAGIESHLALVNTNWLIQPAIPSLDQFNHMVLHVPMLGDGWLLDATDKYLDLARFPADGLWDSHALVLDPTNPRLVAPAAAIAKDSSHVQSRRRVTTSGDAWRVEETFTLQGYYASWMRDDFANLSETDQLAKVQEFLAEQGSARVMKSRVEGVAEPAQDLQLNVEYLVEGSIQTTGASRTAALPALWERDYLEQEFVLERRTPLSWRYPFRFVSDVEVQLPARPTEASVEALRSQGSTKFTRWKFIPNISSDRNPPTLFVHFEFEALPGEHPCTDNAAFHDAWESARRAWSRQITWSE